MGSGDNAIRRYEHGAFERWREGVSHGRRVKTGDGRVQMIEAEFVHGLAELGADPEHCIGLVHDEKAMGAPDAVGHGFHVQRLNRSQIDDFNGDAVLGQDVGGLK